MPFNKLINGICNIGPIHDPKPTPYLVTIWTHPRYQLIYRTRGIGLQRVLQMGPQTHYISGPLLRT